uniref:legumain n=1 Tax=Steinernema glaseri TaxID=37863 RepID=A0A1I8AKU8_9BILA
MRSLTPLLLALLLGAVLGRLPHYHTRRFESSSSEEDGLPEEGEGEIWALLVAGSNGWYNYRHQADVCHSYHVLLNHGIHPDRIITMMYDDIANNHDNPFPGQLFNSPNGGDVYKGVKIDYKGRDVTSKNFLAVLQGKKEEVNGGNGRVIESSKNDKIFVFFSDHGATGLIAFPTDMLTVKQLNDALKAMYAKQKYKELTFYLEACESGSMFENILKKDINVYAITAANAHESSWGCFCDNDLNLPCLGDQFSVNWMTDSDNKSDLEQETLDQQFSIVKRLTDKSHVMHYGDLEIAQEKVSEFQGHERSPLPLILEQPEPEKSLWDVREIPILMLRQEIDRANDEGLKARLAKKIAQIHQKRYYLDGRMEMLVKALIHDPNRQRQILKKHPRHGVTQMECHHDVVNAFNRICFNFNENSYALKYVYVLANLCEDRLSSDRIIQKLMDQCVDIEVSGIE